MLNMQYTKNIKIVKLKFCFIFFILVARTMGLTNLGEKKIDMNSFHRAQNA